MILFYSGGALVALILAGLLVLKSSKPFPEAFARFLLLLPIGIGQMWQFYFETYFSREIEEYLHIVSSSFEGRYSLSLLTLGVAGILSFRKSRSYCLAVSIVSFCYLGGAGILHLIAAMRYHLLLISPLIFSEFAIAISLFFCFVFWRKTNPWEV